MNPLNLGNTIDEELMNFFNEEKYDNWKKTKYPTKKSVAEQFEAVTDKPHIVVVGDYDVDGIMSTKEVVTLLQRLHPEAQVDYIIPRRFTDGYGISEHITEAIIEKYTPNDTCIVTVDNGISQFNALNKLFELGFSICLTDHHTPQKNEDGTYKLPLADCIINPHVLDAKHQDDFAFEHYCGAGVIYKLAQELLSKEEVRKDFLPYAAIATIADVMPLIEDNWVMVHSFLEQIEELLPEELNFTNKPAKYVDETDIGFSISPVLNAAGRLLDDGATQVLDYIFNPTADKMAILKELNEQRKTLSKEQTELAEKYMEEHQLTIVEPICINISGLHHGIIGIIAGNITEKYNRACMVCSDGKGSGRGPKEFDIFGHCLKHFDLFSKCGGHPGACGFSITDENFEKFAKFSIPSNRTKQKQYDVKLENNQITEFYQKTKRFRPFGEENPSPRCLVSVRGTDNDYVGKKQDETGNTIPNPIHFSMENSDGSKIVHFNHRNPDTMRSELKDDNEFDGIGLLSTNYYKPEPKINPKTGKPYPPRINPNTGKPYPEKNPLTIQLKLSEVYDPEEEPITFRR